jgi:hypothetical protein
VLLVYISSTGDTPLERRKAFLIAEEMWNDGIASTGPHLNHFSDVFSPRPAEEWLLHNLELVGRCDALLRLPQDECHDADCEVVVAKERNIPVFYDYKSLYRFAREALDG